MLCYTQITCLVSLTVTKHPSIKDQQYLSSEDEFSTIIFNQKPPHSTVQNKQAAIKNEETFLFRSVT